MDLDRTIDLLFGIVSLSIGIIASTYTKWKKFITYLPIALGLFLIYSSTIGPLSETTERINEVINIDSSKVRLVVFQPTRFRGNEHLSMFTTDSLVDNRNSINEICDCLRKAKVIEDGLFNKNRFIKNPNKVCRVEIHFTNDTIISFGVRKLGDRTCITLGSDGEYGWQYEQLDANEFGILLANYK